MVENGNSAFTERSSKKKSKISSFVLLSESRLSFGILFLEQIQNLLRNGSIDCPTSLN